MRLLGLTLAVFIAGCQSEARRLLLVDLTLADPLVLETTARPGTAWSTANFIRT